MSYAFNRLESLVGVKPEKIASASLGCIADAIKPAGLYNRRSKILKHVADEILNRFNGDLGFVLAKPYTKAKKILMELPGIGPKTADVVLMFVAEVQVIPIDRHIFRIAKRLKIVDKDVSYDGVKLALENLTPPEKRKNVHILLIRFGKEICKAVKPACTICFLNDICPSRSQIN
jgi:endonuclease-3